MYSLETSITPGSFDGYEDLDGSPGSPNTPTSIFIRNMRLRNGKKISTRQQLQSHFDSDDDQQDSYGDSCNSNYSSFVNPENSVTLAITAIFALCILQLASVYFYLFWSPLKDNAARLCGKVEFESSRAVRHHSLWQYHSSDNESPQWSSSTSTVNFEQLPLGKGIENVDVASYKSSYPVSVYIDRELLHYSRNVGEDSSTRRTSPTKKPIVEEDEENIVAVNQSTKQVCDELRNQQYCTMRPKESFQRKRSIVRNEIIIMISILVVVQVYGVVFCIL